MAEFKLVDKNKYRIKGILTLEDIYRINSFKNRTTLIIDNTVGLTSELISKINSDRVVFSVLGGLDYERKEKYKEQQYIDRTFVSPSGLEKIIKYFEYNEQMINPEWNEFEKAMFLYNALVVDMDYEKNYENNELSGTIERSLNGILYSKLVCAGFSLVYKEMLDRIGIKNYYQNQKDIHDFNIIEIDGKKYGVDVTWDNGIKNHYNGLCQFEKFGRDSQFYDREGHQLYRDVDVSDDFEKTVIERVYDKDEEIFELSLLDDEHYNTYRQNIHSAIVNRKRLRFDLKSKPIEVKNKYLPVDVVKYNLTQGANEEYKILIILSFLKNRNVLSLDPQIINAFKSRQAYILDVAIDKNGGRVKLNSLGLPNYEIRQNGDFFGLFEGTNEELQTLYQQLNDYLITYFKKYILNVVSNLDSILNEYEYNPDEFDDNRFIESANIYSKLYLISNSPNILSELGFSDEQINGIKQRIANKYNEIRKPYPKEINQKNNDLDYLYAVFGDVNLIWQTIEYDLKTSINESDFISKFQDVDYMIQIFDKYMILGKEEKFDINNFAITKSDLQGLLNTIIEDYKNSKQESNNLNI